MNYCPKCGFKLEEKSVYCGGCGINLDLIIDNNPPVSEEIAAINIQSTTQQIKASDTKKDVPNSIFIVGLIIIVLAGAYYYYQSNKVQLYYLDGSVLYKGQGTKGKVDLNFQDEEDSFMMNVLGPDRYIGEVIPDGKGKLYYRNGQLYYKGEFKGGEQNGYGKEYRSDGEIMADGQFIDGKMYNGIFFEHNGMIKYREKITNGRTVEKTMLE